MQTGRADYVQGFQMFPIAFPDLHTAIDDIFAAEAYLLLSL